MKGLNFLPLAMWAVGIMCVGAWDEHLRKIDGRGVSEDVSKAFASIYVGGLVVFFLIGVAVSVGEGR